MIEKYVLLMILSSFLKKIIILIEKLEKYASGRVINQIWSMAHWGED